MTNTLISSIDPKEPCLSRKENDLILAVEHVQYLPFAHRYAVVTETKKFRFNNRGNESLIEAKSYSPSGNRTPVSRAYQC